MPDTGPADITLYFLNSSRAIRVAWLLEELNLSYTLVASDRAPNGLAPPDFKAKIPSPLGKSPTLTDGGLTVVESGAIVEYLCERYDAAHRLIPESKAARADVLAWIHASEATFAVHAMPILYARWNMPEGHRDALPDLERGMSRNIHNDFNWLEGVLAAQKSKGSHWIVGDRVTAADIMMQFSVEFIMERKLGVGGIGEGKWPEVEAWYKRTQEVESYQRAVQKTGYTLNGSFKK